MKTQNLFASNDVIQHLKALPRNQWTDVEVLYMYQEIENIKLELSISSVVPCTIWYRVQLQLMYGWLNNHRVAYEEEQETMVRRQEQYA